MVQRLYNFTHACAVCSREKRSFPGFSSAAHAQITFPFCLLVGCPHLHHQLLLLMAPPRSPPPPVSHLCTSPIPPEFPNPPTHITQREVSIQHLGGSKFPGRKHSRGMVLQGPLLSPPHTWSFPSTEEYTGEHLGEGSVAVARTATLYKFVGMVHNNRSASCVAWPVTAMQCGHSYVLVRYTCITCM